MKVVKDAQMIPHNQAAIIMINILHLVMRINGRVIDKYLWILIYISVCKDVKKHTAFKKLFKKHKASPRIQSWAIKVVKENGASRIPIKKSAIAKLTINMLVLVRMPRCRHTTAMTMKFPTMVNSIEMISHAAKITVSRWDQLVCTWS